MHNYSIDSMSEERTTSILKQMGELAIKIQKSPQNKALQMRYYFRVLLLDPKPHDSNLQESPRHLRRIYQKITTKSTKEKLNILNDLYNELKDIMDNSPKEAHIPYYQLVNKFYSIANFQVLHNEGDNSGWKSIRDKYKNMLDYSIPKVYIKEPAAYFEEGGLEQIDKRIQCAEVALKKSEEELQNDYKQLMILKESNSESDAKKEKSKEILQMEKEIDEKRKQIKGSHFLILQMKIAVESLGYGSTPNTFKLFLGICKEIRDKSNEEEISRIESDCDFCLILFGEC